MAVEGASKIVSARLVISMTHEDGSLSEIRCEACEAKRGWRVSHAEHPAKTWSTFHLKRHPLDVLGIVIHRLQAEAQKWWTVHG